VSVGLVALCHPEVAAGFALAGIATIAAPTAPVAADRLREILERPAIGLVLLEEGFHRELPDDLLRQLGRRPLPMVVPFPGGTWATAEAAESYIVELLRQVIGYRVRLR
jgi:vacuolar-type H+-ATPase subunit F/Vma7